MKKTIAFRITTALFVMLLIANVSAGIGSSIPVNGKHYNLNIIGAKNVGEIGDSDGHTMFVKLNGNTKIIMTQDTEGQFRVTDRNGLDGSASFNLAPGKYNIYAAALGKPNGKTSIGANGIFEDAVEGSTLILLGYVDIERSKGSPKGVNINELFYVDVTLCTAIDNEGNCTEYVKYEDFWVFDIEELLGYYWDYNDNGLKLLQVRFYECQLDPSAQSDNYCRWADGSPIDSRKTVIAA